VALSTEKKKNSHPDENLQCDQIGYSLTAG